MLNSPAHGSASSLQKPQNNFMKFAAADVTCRKRRNGIRMVPA